MSSILARDYPAVQGCVILFAVIIMAVNLLTDILYSVLDPASSCSKGGAQMQAEAVKATQRRTVRNVLRRNLSLTAGCLILLCVVFTALFPGLIASQSPTDQNLTAMLAAPSAEHIWGTDELGRDIFARVIWGTRYDLVIGLAAASIPFVVGTLIGLFTAISAAFWTRFSCALWM